MRIILCVTNDIATDRRVNRIALSLLKIPCNILIIGRVLAGSMALPEQPYQTMRMKLLFTKGPLFYAEYNIRLFLILLFKRADILVADDLDTLPAVFLVSRIRRLPVVYDSHEYFTEVPELIGRNGVKRTWESIEAIILPRLKYACTVSFSIADEYKRKYGITMEVIRNLPFRLEKNLQPSPTLKKSGDSIIIYQGSLNMGRGLETAIRAMQYVSNTQLIIAGTGDVENELRELTSTLSLDEKIRFTGRISASEVQYYTVQADLGISLEEKLGLNYYYALPNKLFDYIQARIPVLVSDLPEMRTVVHQYKIGKVTAARDPYELSLVFTEMLTDHSQRQVWKSNLEIAAKELCWENEEHALLDLYQRVLTEKKPTGMQ
jgi:glycosyltransferase involved in cell wall biosynthesis